MIPLTNWTLESTTLSRGALALIHVRNATKNQIKAIPANGMRYNPAITTIRR